MASKHKTSRNGGKKGIETETGSSIIVAPISEAFDEAP